MKNLSMPLLIIALIATVGALALGLNKTISKNPKQVQCTMEAKMCPDGSAVGRTGPNCEFAECPNAPKPTLNPTPKPIPNPGPIMTDSQACYVGGCSGISCSDQKDAPSTCEYRPEYACYKKNLSTCERQLSGECGWTQTPALQACLKTPPAL